MNDPVVVVVVVEVLPLLEADDALACFITHIATKVERGTLIQSVNGSPG
jgi:hypothetical protein